MPPESTSQEWISAPEAGRVLGIAHRNVARLATEGFLTVRRLPGCDPRYLLDDVRRLADSATVPARASRQDEAEASASTRKGGEIR